MNWRVVPAQHAAERSAVSAHWQMARGLWGLQTVAATAPFVGMVGTAWGIINSFKGCSGNGAYMAGCMTGSSLLLALGLAVSTVALCGYRCLTAQLADFEVEMRNAVLELPDCLAPYILRT